MVEISVSVTRMFTSAGLSGHLTLKSSAYQRNVDSETFLKSGL